MEIQTQELEYCKLNVTCLSSKEELLTKKQEVLEAFRKAPVPGNRKNKASLDAIKVYYKNQINESLKRAMAETCFHETLFQKNIKPISNPQFTSLSLDDNAFKCEFVLFTKPDLTLGQYKDFSIPTPAIKENVEMLTNKFLQELRESAGQSEQFTDQDFVQMGDTVILDYDCFDDGNKVDAVSAQGDIVRVGKTSLEEFEKNLIGMKLGETREFNFSVPANAPTPVAGKTVKFVVTLNSGSKNSPAPIDDELANRFNHKNIDDLMADLSMRASKEYDATLKSKKIEQLTALLLENNKTDVPSWLALHEAKYLASNSRNNWDNLNNEEKLYYIQTASKNVQLGLILEKVREEEPECQLTEEETLEIIKRAIPENLLQKSSLQDTLQALNSSGQLQLLVNRAKDEHTFDFLLKSSKFVE